MVPKCTSCNVFNAIRNEEKPIPAYGHKYNCVEGKGPLDAEVLIITDGITEQGQHLDSLAYNLLKTSLKTANFDIDSIRITSAVRCRAVKFVEKEWKCFWADRPATPEEIGICRKWLIEEVSNLPNLKVIIPLGNVALLSVLGEEGIKENGKTRTITSSRGELIYSEELKAAVIPTYHPMFTIKSEKLRADLCRDLQKANSFLHKKVKEEKPTHYYYFRTPEEARKLFKKLREAGEFSFDCETTSKDRFYGEKILNLSFSWLPGYAVYLPIWEGEATADNPGLLRSDELQNYWVVHYGEDVWNEIYHELKNIFEDPAIKKIGHNIKFDIKFLKVSLNTDGKCLDIDVNNIYFDTMIAHFCLNENAKHGLKELAEEFTDLGSYDSNLDDEYKLIKSIVSVVNKKREKAKVIIESYRKWGQINITGFFPVLEYFTGRKLSKKATEQEISEAIDLMEQADLEPLTAHYGMINVQTLQEYACKDADCTYRLYRIFKPELTKQGLDNVFYRIRMAIHKPLIEAELDGLCLDIQASEELQGIFEAKQKELVISLHEKVGYPISDDEDFKYPINIASYPQIAKLLFTPKTEVAFNFPGGIKIKGLGFKSQGKTKKGNDSTNKIILDRLYEQTDNPILKDIVYWRKYQTLIGTFLEGMRESIDPITGRLHPNFKLHGTVTHRITCENPNLLNIPRDDPSNKEFGETASKIRVMFIPTPPKPGEPFEERKVLVDGDLSQAEVRVFASLSGDQMLSSMIVEGVDFHAYFANQIFHADNPIEDLKLFKTVPELAEERSQTKSRLFGAIYGETAQGAAQKSGRTVEETQKTIDGIFAICPTSKQWMSDIQQFGIEHGYVTTPWGVRRRLPVLKLPDHPSLKYDKLEALRQAVNAPIQGHASDYNSLAMINVYRKLKSMGIWFKPKVIIYDAIMIECMLKDAETVSTELKNAMTAKVKGFNVPMNADVAIVDRWHGNSIKVKESLEAGEFVFG